MYLLIKLPFAAGYTSQVFKLCHLIALSVTTASFFGLLTPSTSVFSRYNPEIVAINDAFHLVIYYISFSKEAPFAQCRLHMQVQSHCPGCFDIRP